MQSLTYGLKPVPFKNRDTQDYFSRPLEPLLAGAGLTALA